MSEKLRPELVALNVVLNALDGVDDTKRAWVLRMAADQSGTALASTPRPQDGGSQLHAHSNGQPTPKAFLAEKRAANDIQRVTCLAYYLTHTRSTAHFKTAELTALNTEGAGSKIGNPAQAVANATKLSGYLATAGGGKKQITDLGEKIVMALPDQDAVRRVTSENRQAKPSRKRKQRGKV